jgi:RimJ/RimL family protein N-acetyltransferase
MKEVHVIYTKRLILRTPQVRDAAAYVHMNTNPENNLFDPTPLDSEGRPDTIGKYESDIIKWRETTAKGEAAFMVVTLPPRPETVEASHDLPRMDLEEPSGEIEGDAVIGMTGFNELKRKTRASGAEGGIEEYLEGNVGVLINAPGYVNKGYGKEALKALIDYGFSTMGCEVLVANTLVENKPFRALMSSLGAGAGKEVDGRNRHGKIVAEALYELEKKDWVRQPR